MATEHKTWAREYLRVSLDKSGRERSIAEQHADNQRTAEQHGWTLGEPYRDTGSASRYARKGRDGYDTLMADLDAGRFGAELLVLWESSRGSRRVSEWVALIEACEQQHVRLHVTTHSRTYDPGNARDRRSLLEDSVDSEYETAKQSERIRRSAASKAEAGEWHGRVPYGYRRRRDPDTGKTTTQHPEPAEAKVIAELFDRLRHGETLNTVALDFKARGIRSRAGRPLSREYLRDLATRPTYAAIRTHQGKEYPGSWPPIVSKETFYTVRGKLAQNTRKSPRPGRGRYVFSQVTRCGYCRGPMSARSDMSGRRYYGCHDKGCTSIRLDDLDAYAEDVILTYLARDDLHEQLGRGRGNGDTQAVRDELATLRARRDEVTAAVVAGDMSAAMGGKAEAQLTERIEALQTRERQLATPPALSSLLTPGKDVARRWNTAPISTKREVARLLLTPGLLGELRIVRSPRPGVRVPVGERVQWIREDGS